MVVDTVVASLAQRILTLESKVPSLDGTVATDPEWFGLIVELWARLRNSSETRRNFRLPAIASIVLRGDGHATTADVVDVSHTGLRISGRLPFLRPGFRVTWIAAGAGADTFTLDVPCIVIWCERSAGASKTAHYGAGLEFVHTERMTWGKGFFLWYYRVYRDFLQGLAANKRPSGRSPAVRAATATPRAKTRAAQTGGKKARTTTASTQPKGAANERARTTGTIAAKAPGASAKRTKATAAKATHAKRTKPSKPRTR